MRASFELLIKLAAGQGQWSFMNAPKTDKRFEGLSPGEQLAFGSKPVYAPGELYPIIPEPSKYDPKFTRDLPRTMGEASEVRRRALKSAVGTPVTPPPVDPLALVAPGPGPHELQKARAAALAEAKVQEALALQSVATNRPAAAPATAAVTNRPAAAPATAAEAVKIRIAEQDARARAAQMREGRATGGAIVGAHGQSNAPATIATAPASAAAATVTPDVAKASVPLMQQFGGWLRGKGQNWGLVGPGQATPEQLSRIGKWGTGIGVGATALGMYAVHRMLARRREERMRQQSAG